MKWHILKTFDWVRLWCHPMQTIQQITHLACFTCHHLSRAPYNFLMRFQLTSHTQHIPKKTIREALDSSRGREARKVYEPKKRSKSAKLTHFEPLLGCEHFYVWSLIQFEPHVTWNPPQVVRWEEEKPISFILFISYVYFFHIFRNIRTRHTLINRHI